MPHRISWTAIVAAFGVAFTALGASLAGSLPPRYAVIAAAISAVGLAIGQGLHSLGVGLQAGEPAELHFHAPPAAPPTPPRD